jgi:hypothetical protein
VTEFSAVPAYTPSYDQTRQYVGQTFWNLAFWFRVMAFISFVAGIVIFVYSPVQNLDDIDE